MTDQILQVLFNIATAAIGAMIAMQLAFYKFRREKSWERKATAYERVIDAFHKSRKFSLENIEAATQNRDVDEARTVELFKIAKEAREEILRACDIGSFVFSEKAIAILVQYEIDSKAQPKSSSWLEYLETDCALTERHMKEFIAEARKDLLR